MLRETSFEIGGELDVAMGATLLVGLYRAGVPWAFVGAWFAGAVALGFGAFFVRVGQNAGRARRDTLRALEEGSAGAPRSPRS